MYSDKVQLFRYCFTSGHSQVHLFKKYYVPSTSFMYVCSSRAVLLHQLQELSERECRARNQNQKLLQDFQKAQNTLSDLVACTEAMNNIRVSQLKNLLLLFKYILFAGLFQPSTFKQMEYERYLEENYPKWQQKLQEKTSEQRKVLLVVLISSDLLYIVDALGQGYSNFFANHQCRCIHSYHINATDKIKMFLYVSLLYPHHKVLR